MCVYMYVCMYVGVRVCVCVCIFFWGGSGEGNGVREVNREKRLHWKMSCPYKEITLVSCVVNHLYSIPLIAVQLSDLQQYAQFFHHQYIFVKFLMFT